MVLLLGPGEEVLHRIFSCNL